MPVVAVGAAGDAPMLVVSGSIMVGCCVLGDGEQIKMNSN